MERGDSLDVGRVVDALDLAAGRPAAVAGAIEHVEQRDEALGALGMVMVTRLMEVRHRRM